MPRIVQSGWIFKLQVALGREPLIRYVGPKAAPQ
jgi:hypothetical protein